MSRFGGSLVFSGPQLPHLGNEVETGPLWPPGDARLDGHRKRHLQGLSTVVVFSMVWEHPGTQTPDG